MALKQLRKNREKIIEDSQMSAIYDEHKHLGGPYSLLLIRNEEGVEKMRSIWGNMIPNPNADVDHYLAVVRSRGGQCRPHIIVLLKNDEPVALLICRLEKRKYEVKVGYKMIAGPAIKQLSVIHGGMLGDLSKQNQELFIDEIMSTLARREADVVFFESVPLTSLLCEARSRPSRLCRDYFPTIHSHWRLNLPGSYDEYISGLSARTRARLKNDTNKLLKKYGGTLQIRCYDQKDRLETILNDIERIAKNTYQRRLGFGFFDSDLTRHRYEVALRKGWLRVYILSFSGNPVAYWSGFRCGRKFYGETTGYDPAYREYHPGIFLLMKMIEQLCDEYNVNWIDFGQGDAEYKRIYCDERYEEMSFYLFSPAMDILLLSSARMVLLSTSRCIEFFLDRFELRGKLKKIWRHGVLQKGSLNEAGKKTVEPSNLKRKNTTDEDPRERRQNNPSKIEYPSDSMEIAKCRKDLERGIPAFELFYEANLCKSKGEARRIISQGGAYVNERRLAEFDEKIGLQDFGDREIVYLRKGRKHQAVVRMI
jgi:hypothetical protein